MKKLSIFLILITIFSCKERIKNNQKREKIVPIETSQHQFVIIENDTIKLNNFSIIEITQNEYSKIIPIKNSFKIETKNSIINYKDHSTTIKLDNGKKINFRDTIPYSEEINYDTIDVTESIMYKLLGYNQSFNCFSFKRFLYEDVDFFIINKSNGEKTKTWNEPILNSKGNLMFCIQNPLFLMWEDVTAGFQLFENKKNKILKLEEINFKNLMTFEGKWSNKDELYLKLLSIEIYMDNQQKTKSGFKYVKLSRVRN